MNHQDTAEDVASRFLNNSHRNASRSQRGFTAVESPSPEWGFVQIRLCIAMKAASLSQATKVPEVTAFICTMSSVSKLFTSFFLILFFKLNLWF